MRVSQENTILSVAVYKLTEFELDSHAEKWSYTRSILIVNILAVCHLCCVQPKATSSVLFVLHHTYLMRSELIETVQVLATRKYMEFTRSVRLVR
jgi:hypothetical protein